MHRFKFLSTLPIWLLVINSIPPIILAKNLQFPFQISFPLWQVNWPEMKRRFQCHWVFFRKCFPNLHFLLLQFIVLKDFQVLPIKYISFIIHQNCSSPSCWNKDISRTKAAITDWRCHLYLLKLCLRWNKAPQFGFLFWWLYQTLTYIVFFHHDIWCSYLALSVSASKNKQMKMSFEVGVDTHLFHMPKWVFVFRGVN